MRFAAIRSPYDPDGSCAIDIAYRIHCHAGIEWDERNFSLLRDESFLKYQDGFLDAGFNTLISLSSLAIALNVVKYKFKLFKGTYSRSKLEDVFRRQDKSYYIFMGTFSQLYGVVEPYIHFVCLYKEDGLILKYDGLVDKLEKEGMNVYKKEPEEILRITGNRMLVWR